MYRYLITAGPITIYTYGAMLASAFVIGTLLAMRRCRRAGLAPERIVDLIFCILLSSLAGARALYVALNWDFYRLRPLSVFAVWEGGLVFYGGLIAAFCAAVLFLRLQRLDVWKAADVLSPSIALGICLGRIGCFLNGCCYGVVSERWGMRFPAAGNPPVYAQQLFDRLIPEGAACSLPVVPAQLYAAAHGLLIFFALLVLDRRKRFDGFLFWMLILLYAAGRFFIESLRYYDENFKAGGLTVSQYISIALVAAAGCFLVMGFKRAHAAR